MKRLAADVSRGVFAGASVDVHLCDDRLDTVRVVIAPGARPPPPTGR